jgi:hypothetical protein
MSGKAAVRYRIQTAAVGRGIAMRLVMHPIVKLFGCMTTLSARANSRRSKSAKSREVVRLRSRGPYERLIGTATVMVRKGTSRDQVDGAVERVMPLPV